LQKIAQADLVRQLVTALISWLRSYRNQQTLLRFHSTKISSTLPSKEEIINNEAQNSASIATIISAETGIDITVTGIRSIENPSASPSISPTAILSQKPTLSNKPAKNVSQAVLLPRVVLQSQTIMPTKPENRTYPNKNLTILFALGVFKRKGGNQAQSLT